MKRIHWALLVFLGLVTAGFLQAQPAPPADLLDADGGGLSIGRLCRNGRGLALLVLKPFPSAHGEALRALSQLSAGVRRAKVMPILVVFTGTHAARARLYVRDARFIGRWSTDPAGRLLDRYEIASLPCWLFYSPEGRVTRRATFLRSKDLARLLADLRKPLRRRRRR